jgi:acyl-CoA thioester hydrolase
MYAKTFTAGWADMDFNAHMRNTAFLDRAADVRMMFFSEHGFPMSEFRSRRVGPVIMKDELEYFREIALLDQFSVSLALAGLSQDGSRFLMCNDVLSSAGKLCARVTSTGGWLDLGVRKLVAPPIELRSALDELSRTERFAELPTSLKTGA